MSACVFWEQNSLQLLMSSGVGLFSREGRINSKRFLQPPQMSSNFDIFSSQERDPSVVQGPIQDLSNVEERSNFDSEIQEPDQSDIAEYLAKVQLLDERQAAPPPRITRSQRLEDQEIIVVEEGAEVSSDVGGNESVILEHIEFVNDAHPENTPEWEEPRSREGRREESEPSNQQSMQEVNYVINLVPESPWMNDNMSSSSPYDIESSGFKPNPNRNSKNTCVDRTEPLLPHRPNKSCIEQPICFLEQPPTPKLNKHSSMKGCDIKHILDKWNQQLYPRLEGQYLDAPANIALIPPGRRASADFHIERDAKFCHSGFEDPQSPTQSRRLPFNHTAETGTQTDIAGDELLHNQQYLTEQIAQLRAKNMKLQEEVRSARSKEVELQGKSQRQTVEQSEHERRWGDESRKLSSRNRQLERVISQQKDAIRQFQERQESLEKKLHQTVSYQTLQSSPDDRSPTFFAGQFQSVKLNKLHTFGQEEHINSHEKCHREVEELQETIFDLKQQIAGIDIEVERRVRIISQALQQEVEEKAARDAHSLREELSSHKQALRRLEENIEENEQRNAARQRDISQREKEVSRMYDELVKEWKEMERKGDEQRKRHKTQIKASNFYSTKVAPKGRFDFDRSPHVPEKEDPPTPYYLSSRELNPSFSTRNRGLPQRSMEVMNNHSVSCLPPDDSLSISFRRPARANDTDRISASFTQMGQGQGQGELCSINSKIQRLRQEINRQLCAFHP